MRLASRLLAGSLIVVTALVAAIVLIAGSRLHARLLEEKTDELSRAARVVAAHWSPGIDADSLAHTDGAALGYRVTLIDSAGNVVGDAEFSPDARRRLENHATRPEIIAARASGIGSALRQSASAGDEELYVAVRHPLGFTRVSITTARLESVVNGAQRDVLASGLVALGGALILALFFARSISQPVVELRDVARAIAGGDLSRRPALSAPGEIGDLATALQRMTEQLATRVAALQEDDLLMIALIESLEEGVLALDDRGTVVRINERGRALLNVQTPLPIAPEHLPREHAVRAAIADALAGEATAPQEMTLFDRTVTVSARPLPTAGAVVTILDLTMLRRLETIRRDFVANVSHELKTPLTVVSGYAETLLDEGIPTEQRRKFVKTIRDNAMRMQRIVDELLDLSRIESGGWRPKLATVDVTGVVSDVFMALQPSANGKGLTLVSDISPDAVRLTADHTAFRQVITNLVENAVRYTKEGSITLQTRRGDGGVWVDVRDTGVGIAAEHLPRIFERFYRVDAGRSREQGGTGLGLAIVRHLMEAHGGRVEAASTLGKGTTISAFFPSGKPA
ncbi:MAG: phoR [Gemmatimonadetes bacterium]|nr:phoR [Gemmatimonadota bacterium]